MFYEECTLNEIRAQRNLESEIFDFGEGEMEIEGWYGSEDAYLSMSLPEYYDYPEYYNSINSEDKYKKQKQRLNRYAKKQIDKEKLKKLYPPNSYQPEILSPSYLIEIFFQDMLRNI